MQDYYYCGRGFPQTVCKTVGYEIMREGAEGFNSLPRHQYSPSIS